MWKRLAIPLFATMATFTVGAGTALAVQAGTASGSPATSAKTWTVKPGGSISGTSGEVVAKDTATGATLNCKSAATKGTSKAGTGLPGLDIMPDDANTDLGCTGPDGLAFKIVNHNFPWEMNAVSYDASTGVSQMTIHGIEATTTGSNCSLQVGGLKAGTGGMVHATYTNGTHKLTILTTASTLHLWNVKGCSGMVKDGDPSTFAGTYTLTPQTMTSP